MRNFILFHWLFFMLSFHVCFNWLCIDMSKSVVYTNFGFRTKIRVRIRTSHVRAYFTRTVRIDGANYASTRVFNFCVRILKCELRTLHVRTSLYIFFQHMNFVFIVRTSHGRRTKNTNFVFPYEVRIFLIFTKNNNFSHPTYTRRTNFAWNSIIFDPFITFIDKSQAILGMSVRFEF